MPSLHHLFIYLFPLLKKKKKIEFTIMARRPQETTRLKKEATSAVIHHHHHHHHHSSSLLMEHRSSTNARHLALFWAVAFASHHVSPLSPSSNILVRLRVCRVSLSCASPMGSIRGLSWPHARLFSSRCGQSISKLVLLSPPLSAAALSASTAHHFGFFWATKSVGCSLDTC